jgi:hypothetical protein
VISVDDLVSLAKEVELEDSIDWGMMPFDEDTVYRMLATSIIEFYSTLDKDLLHLTLLATVLKLTAENFVLNYNNLRKV